MIDRERLMETLLELVDSKGISGTDSENESGEKIISLLKEIPYFAENPQDLMKLNIEGDIYNRFCAAAFLKRNIESGEVLILCGHLDVVDIEEFGHLKEIAFKPLEYAERIEELGLGLDALNDLKSGDWLFGRGTADMKCGLALSIELLREYADKKDFKGNILFLAVPGEETNSEGMLRAAEYIAKLQEEGFNFKGLLMTECYETKSPGDGIRHIHIGASGKMNALFYFVGKGTHVDEPFGGLNANSLASELNRLLDSNPDFCDSYSKNVTSPPVCLKQSDLKDLYSGTTPLYGFAYYSMMTYSTSPHEIMNRLKELCRKAFENVLVEADSRRREYEKKIGLSLGKADIEPFVCEYSEIHKEVMKTCGEEFTSYINSKIVEWRSRGIDSQMISVNIVRETIERYPARKPMIVIGFIPPYYPHRYPNTGNLRAARVLEAVDDVINYADEVHSEKFKVEDFYGVSDLSYTGLSDERGAEEMKENLIGLGSSYIFNIEALKSIDLQGIVLGGWAKDFHKTTERLNKPFFLNVLPDLYTHFIDKVFSEDN